MAVARRAGGEILSVDALKVYRGMDAGTAKPSAAERAEIPHHGIDLVGAHEEFSVTQFLDYAEETISAIRKRGKVPILDVTAPFYLKALVYGVERGPAPNADFRAEMQHVPAHDLHARLAVLDPEAARKIGPADHKRLVRALEIARFSSKLPSEAARWGEPRGDYRWLFTGIRWPRDVLYQRVRQRAQQMFEAGWIDEVKRILATGGISRTAGLAHGYRRIQELLAGSITLDECVEQTVRDVKLFARKSMTFFKGFPKVQWLDVSSEEELDRAAMYLSHELKEMLIETGVKREPVDLP